MPLEPLPFFGDNQRYGPNSGSIGSWVKNAYQLLIGAGAILAVAMIVAGALTYMFSDVVGNKTKAIARIRNAMWGLVILVSSYLILVTINPELTTFNLNLQVRNNYDASPTPARPASTKLTVSGPNTFQVYNGENAPTEIARLQDQCKSPKSLNQIGEEADTHGTYTVWKCQ